MYICVCVLQCVSAAVPAVSLLHTATHCNTLQHAATHCNTLQHIVCCRVSALRFLRRTTNPTSHELIASETYPISTQ